MTATAVNSTEPDRTATPLAPVTTVPTGKVKLHQESEKGRPARAVRTVMAATSAAQNRAKPSAGTPYSSANTSAPPAYGSSRTAWALRPSR